MDPHAALNILNQATAHFRGTREEHIMVQQALEVLGNAINPSPAKPVAADEPPQATTKKTRK